MSVPSWVQDSVFYQIFPDRFSNGHPANDPKSVVPWDSKPTNKSFHGGDIKGIIDRMYYLLDLGVNAIYLNPIFLSPSNHRYNAVDYFQIDPKLGTKVEFLTFLDIAHRNEMKVILDGVFNHCGRGFFAFNDILENQDESPYVDWFHITKFPVDAYSPGDSTTYEAWWRYKSLPKFNTSNPDVQKYILKVARYWIENGIDGWRLDVPNEIDDDDFWLRFRNDVKSANPNAYLVGEIWDGDPRWVGEEHFDGLMNYPLRTMIINLLSGKSSVQKFIKDYQKWQNTYPEENLFAMYNLLGSHDTERFLTMLDGNQTKAKLGYLIQFTVCGSPAIYYGDEIGFLGEGDPDCRHAFEWDETKWNTLLRDWIKKLVRLRKEKACLSRGKLTLIENKLQPDLLAYFRESDYEGAIVAINLSDAEISVDFDLEKTQLQNSTRLRNLMAAEKFDVNDHRVSVKLAANTGMLLYPEWNV